MTLRGARARSGAGGGTGMCLGPAPLAGSRPGTAELRRRHCAWHREAAPLDSSEADRAALPRPGRAPAPELASAAICRTGCGGPAACGELGPRRGLFSAGHVPLQVDGAVALLGVREPASGVERLRPRVVREHPDLLDPLEPWPTPASPAGARCRRPAGGGRRALRWSRAAARDRSPTAAAGRGREARRRRRSHLRRPSGGPPDPSR